MRVVVESIPVGGRVEQVDETTAWASQAAAEAVDGTIDGLSATLRLEPPQGKEVLASVEASVRFQGTCDRCGEPVRHALETSISLRYLPAGAEVSEATDEEGVELAEDELDLGWYEDGSLVLADVLTEALALATPSRLLCEDQAGCDARTEAMLAEASDVPAGHPGFAALKNFKN